MRERFKGLAETLGEIRGSVGLCVPTYGQRLRELICNPPLSSSRKTFPILTGVNFGYGLLVEVKPHWASDLMKMIESLVVGK